MAESLQKKITDFKEESLTCSICTEPFDNGAHQAKYLPCLHSFCKSCLKQRAGKKKTFDYWRPTFDCPICRVEVNLSGKTIDSLSNNFLIETRKEYQEFMNVSPSCGNCDKDNKAVSFCHDCGYYQCSECVNNHQMKILKHHKLSTLKELHDSKRKPSTQQYCEKHPMQQVNLYCNEESCHAAMCASCGLVNHQGHNLVDLYVAANEVVTKMKGLTDIISEKKKRLVSKQEDLDFEETKKRLKEGCALHSQKMSTESSEMQSLLARSYSAVWSDYFDLHTARKTTLTTQKETLDSLVAQMTSAHNFATTLCDISNPEQLLTVQREIMNRLTELRKTKIPKLVSIKTDFVFSEKHTAAMKQISECLKSLKEFKSVE